MNNATQTAAHNVPSIGSTVEVKGIKYIVEAVSAFGPNTAKYKGSDGAMLALRKPRGKVHYGADFYTLNGQIKIFGTI